MTEAGDSERAVPAEQPDDTASSRNAPKPTREHRALVERLAGKYSDVEFTTEAEDVATSALARRLGPCYTQRGIAHALDMPEQQVKELTSSIGLLALTVSNIKVYPAFQVLDGYPVPGLADVLRALQTGTEDRWVWGLWLVGTPAWSVPVGSTPRPNIDTLIAGYRNEVVAAAMHVAVAWRDGRVSGR